MIRNTKLALSIVLLGSAFAANADLLFYDSAAPGPYKWCNRVVTGTGGSQGIQTFNATNDGFISLENWNCFEKAWFQWKKGGGAELPVNGSTFSTLESEETTQVGANVTRTIVVSQRDPGFGNKILETTLVFKLVPVSVDNTNPGLSKAYLQCDWTVKNISTSAQSFSTYALADMYSTISGIGGNSDDTCSVVSGGIGQNNLRVSWSSPSVANSPTVYFDVTGSNLIAAGEISSGVTPPVRTKLTDSASDTLSGAMTGGSSNNWAAGIQYNHNLAIGQSTSGRFRYGYNVLPSTVSGKVTLDALSVPMTGKQVTVDLRTPSTLTVIESKLVTLDVNGNYSFETTNTGSYDVAIKGSHFLRKVVPGVSITGAGATVSAVTLRNGDATNDNFADFFDYLVLNAGYETESPDPIYVTNQGADFNEDGTIDFFDYLILSDQYETQGDD
ncbi:MAG: hypothetical protein JNM85_07460 [Chthonomonas sp.]|nr:hypothetical protein [Chthonomonas sp.]